MSSSKTKNTSTEIDTILNFLNSARGLTGQLADTGRLRITQGVDGRSIQIYSFEISEVLSRSDSEGKEFLQVNFKNGNKILLTDSLIGFKPAEVFGLDMLRIPKVVTTPDLVSVFDAIEESIGLEESEAELEVLKKVYQSILTGAEKIGFESHFERKWINRLMASKQRASA